MCMWWRVIYNVCPLSKTESTILTKYLLLNVPKLLFRLNFKLNFRLCSFIGEMTEINVVITLINNLLLLLTVWWKFR